MNEREYSFYYILSGEGDIGTWTGPIPATKSGIQQRARRKRCGGARWAKVFEVIPESETVIAHLIDIVTGDLRDIPYKEEK